MSGSVLTNGDQKRLGAVERKFKFKIGASGTGPKSIPRKTKIDPIKEIAQMVKIRVLEASPGSGQIHLTQMATPDIEEQEKSC
jgi:hypothetical protein